MLTKRLDYYCGLWRVCSGIDDSGLYPCLGINRLIKAHLNDTWERQPWRRNADARRSWHWVTTRSLLDILRFKGMKLAHELSCHGWVSLWGFLWLASKLMLAKQKTHFRHKLITWLKWATYLLYIRTYLRADKLIFFNEPRFTFCFCLLWLFRC